MLTSIWQGLQNTLQHNRSKTVTEHLIQTFELYSIAQALAVCFKGMMHHESAKDTFRNVAMLYAEECYISPSPAASSTELEAALHKSQCHWQDWVPLKNSLTNNNPTSLCICPIMAYLQYTTWCTPIGALARWCGWKI